MKIDYMRLSLYHAASRLCRMQNAELGENFQVKKLARESSSFAEAHHILTLQEITANL